MAIASTHKVLSAASKSWLISVANPFRNSTQLPSLGARETGDVLKAAELHGVLPIALRALLNGNAVRRHFLKGTAAEIADAEKEIGVAQLLQLHQTGFEMLLTHHCDRILRALSDAGVRAANVKGPSFARRLYSTPALRAFTDIDILVVPADRKRANGIMADLGFQFLQPEYREGKDYLEDNWILRSNPRVSIELHSDLVHNPTLRRSSSVTYDDVCRAGDGDCEDATALLLVAAAHAAVSHQFDRLQHILDIALAASGCAGSVNVQRLINAANTSGVATGLHAGLSLAGRMFEHKPLIDLASSLAPTRLASFAGWIMTGDAVMAARGEARSASSWRRKILRQIIR